MEGAATEGPPHEGYLDDRLAALRRPDGADWLLLAAFPVAPNLA
jgi:hypothetical protein